jgi:ABC-2 type transport system ATP-binding protein
MLRISNLVFRYKKGSFLFDNLNLELIPGNIYGLLGKNGAGKTTLLKIMCGLLFPKEGECLFNGMNPAKRDPRFLADLYFVPDSFYLPNVKISEYVKLYSPFYEKFNKGQFEEYLNKMEVNGDVKLNSLSFGQKKKFIISFGLATNASLILLDEPTNGLDIPSKAAFRKILASITTDEKIIVISTHQVRDMKNLIDPIIILDDGKIILNRSMEEVSSKISMSFQPNEPKEDEALYYENTLGGYALLKENNDGIENEVDLEMLANLAAANNKVMMKLLNKGEKKHE